VQNSAQKPLERAKEALKLIQEMEQSYSHQLIKVQDPEITAKLEAIKMLHWSNEKKLRDYLASLTEERPIVDG
jgi:hypothetical protein